MEEKTTYSAEEVAQLIECDAQKLRSQVKSDIAQGRNSQNFNAFQIGSTLKFPKKWIDKKLGIGPVFVVPDWFAELLIKAGMATEEINNDENV